MGAAFHAKKGRTQPISSYVDTIHRIIRWGALLELFIEKHGTKTFRLEIN
jgi:hypothetical protein